MPSQMPADWPRPEHEDSRPARLPKAKEVFKSWPPRLPGDLPFPAPEPFVWLAREDDCGNWRRTRVVAEPGGGLKVGLRIQQTRIGGRPAHRLILAAGVQRGEERVAAFGVEIPFPHVGDPHLVQVSVPGACRVERWRVDQSDERIPEWLNSDSRTRWPVWRGGGILLGPGESYRIFKLNLPTTSPLFVDQGIGSAGWLDVTDRAGDAGRGLTARPVAGRSGWERGNWRGVTFDFVRRQLVVWFHSPCAAPLDPEDGPFVAAVDLVAHDGWRPPLLPPALTRKQFAAFLEDLDYGENIGLFALRFLFADTHQVRGDKYRELLMQSGLEPSEILRSMLFRDGLRKHCEKLKVPYDETKLEATIELVIDRYR